MERLSNAIQNFHDEIVNLKAQVDSLENHVAHAPEDKAADTLTNKMLMELSQHVTDINAQLNHLQDVYVRQILSEESIKDIEQKIKVLEEICEDGAEYVFKQSEHEFHNRIKMLERNIYGYEAGMGLNWDFENLEKKVNALEEKVNAG